jgi:hypothetical protein
MIESKLTSLQKILLNIGEKKASQRILKLALTAMTYQELESLMEEEIKNMQATMNPSSIQPATNISTLEDIQEMFEAEEKKYTSQNMQDTPTPPAENNVTPTITQNNNSRPPATEPQITTSGKPKALVFGNSIAGGLGLAFKSRLSGAYDVTLDYNEGWNDSRLAAKLQQTYTPEQFNRVFLFVGGNSGVADTSGDINKMINYFGAGKVTVVLMPVCSSTSDAKCSRVGQDMLRTNQMNQSGIGVKAEWVIAGPEDFTPDRVHIKPNSPAANDLASKLT